MGRNGRERSTDHVAANDNAAAEARVRSAVLTIARLLGRQIAREQFERLASASCSTHVMTGTCSNGRGIRRTELEERVLVGLKDRLMAPDEQRRRCAPGRRRPTGSIGSAGPRVRRTARNWQRWRRRSTRSLRPSTTPASAVPLRTGCTSSKLGRKNCNGDLQLFPPRFRTSIRISSASTPGRWRASRKRLRSPMRGTRLRRPSVD